MTQAPPAEPKPETAQADTPQADTPQADQAEVEVADAELNEAVPSGAPAPGGQIDVLLDTKVQISATLGTVRMPVRQLLESGPGAVIQLDRTAGEPVDLYLNDIRFATGHLVCVGEQLGVRIKEILRAAGDEAIQAKG